LTAYGHLLIISGFDFFGLVRRNVKTSRRAVAFTFDDGPSLKYTTRILDILKENGAHATFFVTGRNAARNPELIMRMIREENQIGNHTYNHYFLFTKSGNVREDEIMKTHELIKNIAGTDMKYFRAPYEYRDLRLIFLLRGLNYKYISHDTGTLDGSGAASKKIVGRILRGLHPGAIISMHDARGHRTPTVEALKAVMPAVRARGCSAVTLDELLAMEGK
jgi:peptidoglycan-N-acetylglucosamine deacetylase